MTRLPARSPPAPPCSMARIASVRVRVRVRVRVNVRVRVRVRVGLGLEVVMLTSVISKTGQVRIQPV